MSGSLNKLLHRLHRDNEKMAERMGLLAAEKAMAAAPSNYRLASEDETVALDEAGIPYFKRVCMNPQSKTAWVHPDVYELICAYEEHDGFAGMTLGEWLSKTYVDSMQ